MPSISCGEPGGRRAPLRRRWMRAGVAAVVMMALLTLAVLSASASPTKLSAGVPEAARKAAQAELTKGEKPPVFRAPGPAFNPKAAKGKTLWIIDILSSIPLVQVTDEAATTALKLVGAKVVRYDGKGSVSEYAAGIRQAIAQHASAIALFAIDPALVAGPLQQAKAAGIPVIVLQYGDAGAKMPFGLKAQVTYCYSCAGRLMADYIIAHGTKRLPSVAVIESKEVTNSRWEVGGFVQRFRQLCPKCELRRENIPVADWQTKLSTLTQSLVRSHPDLDYVVPIYDGMALFVVPAIRAAGAAKRVGVVT